MSALVGPVLQSGAVAEAVIAALRAQNEDIQTLDRGAYVRVLAVGACGVTRAAIEAQLGALFQLPGDLERIMPSFQGRFEVDEEHARWFVDGVCP
jgi:hypothetical protein